MDIVGALFNLFFGLFFLAVIVFFFALYVNAMAMHKLEEDRKNWDEKKDD